MPSEPDKQAAGLTEILNRDCHCIDVDREALAARLAADLAGSGLAAAGLDLASYPFAPSPVFVSSRHIEDMARFVAAYESTAFAPAVSERLLAHAPPVARADFATRGAFCSYDFHLGPAGPRLIEVNTNAGGVLLNLYLAAAQQACCVEVDALFGGQADFGRLERDIVAMFRDEWRLQRGTGEPRTIAIVDVDPPTQPLYAEFVLFRSLFSRNGIEAVIVDPAGLRRERGGLYADGRPVDLVYNRLTDFYFEQPASAVLRDAYLAGEVVVTPAPRHYARLADKRNLPLMSDACALRDLGIDADRVAVLERMLPRVQRVTSADADELWARRRQLFFKPATGFGSRGAYRGAKLTRRVWDEILAGDYVAQEMVPPSERRIRVGSELRDLKVDLRCVTYAGRILQLSARLYQGQTTNLRTEGGGLATVFAAPDDPAAACA